VPTKDLTYRIGADYSGLRREMESGSDVTRKQQQELRKLEEQQRRHRQTITQLGVGFLTFGAAAAFGLGAAINAAIKWESAFAGVRKTVDGSDEEIAALEGELRGLARTLPATHEEIAAVAEAAGQLGIKRQDIAKFTETMVALGVSTNLSAEEAAEALAKFSNIMGTSAQDVDRLGSTLVALGNAGASTEADIIAMGLRIAGAGKQIGLTESQVLAFASSLSSVGIEAEAGGSAFSGVMVKMAMAVEDGSDKLGVFAKVAGMSGDQFTQKFQGDAAGAIQAFIAGLGRMQASGGDVFGTLESLGLSEIRVRDALLRAGAASDMFSDSLKTGSKAWAENSALAAEAEKRYATTEAQIAMAGNAIKDAAIDIGAALLPIVQGGIEVIRNLITWFQNLPGPIKTAVAVLGLVTAGVGLLGGAALVATPKVLAFRESMRTMVAEGGKFSGAMGKFGLFMSGPWGVAIGAGIALLGLFGAASGGAEARQQELAEAGKSVAQAIKEQGGAINDSVRQTAAKAAADEGMLDAARGLGIELTTVTDAILGQGDAYDQLRGKLEAIIEAGTLKGTAGKGGQATRFTDEANAAKELLNNLDALVGGKNKELQTDKDVAAASKETTETTGEQTDATGDLKKAAEEATAALDAMVEALDKINGVTLSHREAQRALVKAVAEGNAVFAENAKTLNIHTADGMENAEALDGIASAMNDAAEAAAREAESTGGAAAGQSALQASLKSSRQQLFNIARQFFTSEQAAWDYVDSVLAIPEEANTDVNTPGSATAKQELQLVFNKVKAIPPGKSVNVGVLSAEAIRKLEQMGFKVRTLPDGSVSVSANTSAAQNALNRFIGYNYGRQIPIRVVTTYETIVPRIGGRQYERAYGGIVHFAQGGEHHTPMIARAQPGTVRVWAEPETGGESYIPWAMDRRGRATDVLARTADEFGYALVPKGAVQRFAAGGTSGATGGSGGVPSLDVHVYMDGREITDRVDVRIAEHDRQTRRAIGQGAGRAR
jgi:TP901 family phage tail tape measure protein